MDYRQSRPIPGLTLKETFVIKELYPLEFLCPRVESAL